MLNDAIDRALERRAELVQRLAREGTDAFRLFHSRADGVEGLTLDRYGALVLAQTFREPLEERERDALEAHLRRVLGFELAFVYNHRAGGAHAALERWHDPQASALDDHVCREFGVSFLARARHRGLDPWLFLDLRAGRRRLRELAPGKRVLNLFAATCSAGITALAAGAREVWNVDFARSSLAVGARNAQLNACDPERLRTLHEDCLPVLRQLAGLPLKGRSSSRAHLVVQARRFDVVFLDPPAWSKGPYGAVDVERDYQALFKPALLATEPGGVLIATNHVASVELDAWRAILERAAAKASRPLRGIEVLEPEADFPSFDGRPPLKIAVCAA